MEAVTNLAAPAAAIDATAALRPIRPCMISFYFHPDYSGSAIQALNLSRHLVGLGLRPFVVAANLTDSAARDQFAGIPLYRLPVLRSRDWQIPSFSASLMRFLVTHRHEYDLIHAHGTYQHVIAALAGRWLGKPTLLKIAMANSDIAFHRQGRLYGRVNRALVRRFDNYIATTPAIADEIVERGLDSSRTRLMPNGVDTDVFAALSPDARAHVRRGLGLPEGPIVTYVGVIISRKNIDGILRIWQAVCRSHGTAHLLLLGPTPAASDPFYNQLTAFVRDNALSSRVTFAGFKQPVVPYLQASDAFLFPSHQEGMANSVLEAMSCGVPVFVSNSAGVAALVRHGESGYVFPPDDEAGFANALVHLLADRGLRERIGAEARRMVVSRFSLAATAMHYAELYGQLLGRAPALRDS
jgi:glycosyltransferase involved in cell wall biosynthesis